MAIVILSGTSTDLSNVSNYSTGALPSNGDTLIVEKRSASFTTGLTALSGIALDTLVVRDSFTGSFSSLTGSYVELDADKVIFDGRGAVNLLDFGANSVSYINVMGTASQASDGLPALRILGSAIDDINVVAGSVGVACHKSNETATISKIVAGGRNSGGIANVRIGPGATVTTIEINDGAVINEALATVTTIEINSPIGSCISSGGNITTLTINNGSYIDQANNSTIATLVLSGGTYDASQSPTNKNITNLTINSGKFCHLKNTSVYNVPLMPFFEIQAS